MTTNQITLYQFESGRITTPTNKKCTTGTSPIEIFRLFHVPSEQTVDEMFAQLELNDSRAAAATEVGNKWVANTFFLNDSKSLATLRLRAGLSQRELGERLNVSQPQIAKWEKGETPNMQLRTIRNLSQALSVSMAELLGTLVDSIGDSQNER